ncbi:MAG: DUF1735 and LamG domain-containing protein [Candidatus Cryptobacteroides sp.]
MKRINFIMFVGLLACISCKEVAGSFDAIYFTEAQNTNLKTVTIDLPPMEMQLTVSASSLAQEDIEVEIEVRDELVDEFNRLNGTAYKAAPKSSFTLSDNLLNIGKGLCISNPLELKLISTEDFVDGDTYCIPLKISRVSAMQILEPSSTIYIIIKKPVISKGIYLGSNNIYSVPSFQQDNSLSALKELTLETRVYVNSFQRANPFISSIMGIEAVCCMRFGDVKVDNNVVQICHDDYQPAATALPCDTGRWYHVAAVWSSSSWDIYIDGQYATGTPTAGETMNLCSDNSGGFFLGASYLGGRPLDGYIAETRVWTRALSQAEIANNMNYVDPASPGLLAYWRMNVWTALEGGGNVVPDLTGHGHDAIGRADEPLTIDTKWL